MDVDRSHFGSRGGQKRSSTEQLTPDPVVDPLPSAAEKRSSSKMALSADQDPGAGGKYSCVGAVESLHDTPDYSSLEDLDWSVLNRSAFADKDVCQGKIEGLKIADEYGIYEVVQKSDTPGDARKVDTKWDIKFSKGRVKCRLVGREYKWLEQRDDTFAPTSGNKTSRAIDVFAMKTDTDPNDPMVVWIGDCISAFYQAVETEDFYCDPPVEWMRAREAAGLPLDVLWKLKKQLPGRRRVAACWTDQVGEEFAKVGLSQFPGATHIYSSLDERCIMVDTHMDDFHCCARRSAAGPLIEQMREAFVIKASEPFETGAYEHLKRDRWNRSDGTVIQGN